MKTKTLKPARSSSSKSWAWKHKSDIVLRLRLESSKKLRVESVSRVSSWKFRGECVTQREEWEQSSLH
jgi:hypothetical protein